VRRLLAAGPAATSYSISTQLIPSAFRGFGNTSCRRRRRDRATSLYTLATAAEASAAASGNSRSLSGSASEHHVIVKHAFANGGGVK
jgi:hypothetical protein